jgi:predicted transcriptional regulator
VTAWSFLTNHALVLAHLGQRPASTGLEIAQAVGITERAVRKIVADLHSAGYIQSERVGRSVTVGELLSFILRDATGGVPSGDPAHASTA